MDDGELVMAVRGGERASYGVLVERHHNVVARICFRVSGNAHDADDLAHDAFVDGYVKLDQLREPERFGPWIRTLALNLCRMWYRRTRRSVVHSLNDDVDTQEAAAIPTGDELPERVGEGLARLSAAHRLAVILHYWEGLSYDDIATFLDVPIGTVMSRLHRARTHLKQLIEDRNDEGLTMMMTGEDFRQEIETEIEALMRIFDGDAHAVERLSVILENAPEHFVTLVRRAQGKDKIDDTARLLARLRRPGIETTVAAALSADGVLSSNGTAVLVSLIRNATPDRPKSRGAKIPLRVAYDVIDVVASSPSHDRRIAELLTDLMVATTDESTALLLMNAVLCYGNDAFDVLLERFRACETIDEVYAVSDILFALARTGTRFVDALVPMLRSSSQLEVMRALAGAEAVARALNADGISMSTMSDDALVLEQRFTQKWPPPSRADRDPAGLDALAETLADLTVRNDIDERDGAIRVLGLLKDNRCQELLRASARHAELSTRLTALRALGDIGDAGAVDLFKDATRSIVPAERRVAAEIVGQLRLCDAQPEIVGLLGDADCSVRRAAVLALGEIDDSGARAVLRDLLRAEDRTMAKAASSALFGRNETDTAVIREPDNGSRRTMGEIVRDGATPLFNISLEAAVRALPDTGPYTETRFSRMIASVCYDFSATRRYLVEQGLARRENSVYELTPMGETIWRVEQFIRCRTV